MTTSATKHGSGVTFVGRDDPRYFDRRYWAEANAGQTWFEARAEQIEAIKVRKAHKKASRRQTKARLSPFLGRLSTAGLRQCPYQMNPSFSEPSGPRFEGQTDHSSHEICFAPYSGVHQLFSSLIPSNPLCTDDPGFGMLRLPRRIALTRRHLQFNTPKVIRFVPFDIDRPDAYHAAEKAALPQPNFVAVNPQNGHSLTGYVLDLPVLKFDGSRRKPVEYLAAIERGMTRRLGADPNYAGVIGKNPAHPHWHVEWLARDPYDLGDLASALTKNDMRPVAKHETTGLGRNCDLFNDVRQWSYVNVLDFKRSGGSHEQWAERLLHVAEGLQSGIQLSVALFRTPQHRPVDRQVHMGALHGRGLRAAAVAPVRQSPRQALRRARDGESHEALAGRRHLEAHLVPTQSERTDHVSKTQKEAAAAGPTTPTSSYRSSSPASGLRPATAYCARRAA